MFYRLKNPLDIPTYLFIKREMLKDLFCLTVYYSKLRKREYKHRGDLFRHILHHC